MTYQNKETRGCPLLAEDSTGRYDKLTKSVQREHHLDEFIVLIDAL